MTQQFPFWVYIIWIKYILSQKDMFICIPTFIAVLFTIAKIVKQPECSSEEWIKKWYIYNHTQSLQRSESNQRLMLKVSWA